MSQAIPYCHFVYSIPISFSSSVMTAGIYKKKEEKTKQNLIKIIKTYCKGDMLRRKK